MPQRRPRFGVVLVALLGLVLTGGCSSPATMTSQSMSQAPSIDGALGDWHGGLSYVKNEPVSMSVVPTDSLLYVALSIRDRRLIRAVAAKGLILWVDPGGGQERGYGIQYPLGLRAQRAGQRNVPSSGQQGPDAASVFDRVNLSELAVVRHDSTRRRIPAHFSSGLRAKATLDAGSMVYELAIPVGGHASRAGRKRHGLTASLSETVGIGLQTPEPGEEDADFAPRGATVPSVTGRPRRGRTRRRRRAARQAQQQGGPSLDVWTQVVVSGPKDSE